MYKICRTEKSLARQRELEEGFLNYMADVPFVDIEIADLCRHLEIPRKTFYRYFGSKEDALYALVDHRLTDLNHCLEEMIRQNASHQELVVTYFSYWKEQRRFLDVLVRNYLAGTLLARAITDVNIPQELQDTPVVKKDTAESYLFTFWTSGSLAMMLQWYASGFQKSIQELADISQILIEPYNHTQ